MEDIRITEILKDYYKVANCYTNAEKKVFADKYSIESRKIKDIQKAMLKLADDYRKEHTVYTEQDWKVWNLLWDFPFSSKKLQEACEGEDDYWIEHILKITKKIWEDRQCYNKDHRYDYILKIKAKRNEKNDTILDKLYNNLTIITFDFKKKLYEKMLQYETSKFNMLKKFNEDEAKEKGETWFKGWVRFKCLSNNFDWEYFKNKIDKEFEDSFSYNIKTIATRIRANKKIQLSNLKLQRITEDPKFFEMILRDCTGNFIHCRSIIAAEYSELVTTHYRFIITIKNAK